jgi:hypothetical protein
VALSRFGGGANVAATAVVGITVGGYDSDFDIQDSGTSPQAITINTQASGSSILAIAFGDATAYAAPTDNKGNTYSLLESSGYQGGLWAPYGMKAYGKANAAGGSSHTVSVVKDTPVNESTLLVIEAKGSTIQDTSVITRAGAGDGVAYTSASVTTTGPALLVAVWSGDGYAGITDMSAAPENGWTLLESLFLTGASYIQAALAVKAVSSAGTYTVDWTPANSQGAILFLAAVQA